MPLFLLELNMRNDWAKLSLALAAIAGVLLFITLVTVGQIETNKQLGKIGVACVEKGGDWDTVRQTCKMKLDSTR